MMAVVNSRVETQTCLAMVRWLDGMGWGGTERLVEKPGNHMPRYSLNLTWVQLRTERHKTRKR